MVKGWMRLGPRLLPFADAVSTELPLGRLLRLCLFQVTVGMAAVLLIGTLNRVMIVELGVLPGSSPSWFRCRSSSRRFARWSATARTITARRWAGSACLISGSARWSQFGGLAIMPFALILLSGDSNAPEWVAQAAAALAFLLVGAGLHTVQTVGLALATDHRARAHRPRVVALLCTMLLLGMVVSAIVFGCCCDPSAR